MSCCIIAATSGRPPQLSDRPRSCRIRPGARTVTQHRAAVSVWTCCGDSPTAVAVGPVQRAVAGRSFSDPAERLRSREHASNDRQLSLQLSFSRLGFRSRHSHCCRRRKIPDDINAGARAIRTAYPQTCVNERRIPHAGPSGRPAHRTIDRCDCPSARRAFAPSDRAMIGLAPRRHRCPRC